MKKSIIFFSLLLSLTTITLAQTNTYDIILTNGQILDGSGSSPYPANLAISQNTIEYIGNNESSADVTIDATGLYIAPGFIDLHTHADRQLTDNRLKNALNYLTQGVTLVVTGNCGGGTCDVTDYFNTLKTQGLGLNTIHLVGHNTVRQAVLGAANRPPTPDELEKMKNLVNKALNEGAAGLSTGLFYAPGSYAQTDEIIELARIVKKHNGFYASHLRDESNYTIGLQNAVREAIQIAESAGVPLQISHLKAMGTPVWNQAPDVCQIIETAQQRGVVIYADQYPYTASSTSLAAATIPRWIQADGKTKQLLQDEKLLPQIKQEIAQNIARRGGPDSLVLTGYRPNPAWTGKSLAYISSELKKSPVDTAIELVLKGSPKTVSHNMTDSDVEYIMKKSYVMTGSDGTLVAPGDSVIHPRSYGAFPRKIAYYALEKQIITLPQAIRSCTSLPAEALNLKNRGLLKTGYVADIVAFNPKTLKDNATFDKPHQYSQGIEYLFVNGVLTIENGKYNGALAGKPIPGKDR